MSLYFIALMHTTLLLLIWRDVRKNLRLLAGYRQAESKAPPAFPIVPKPPVPVRFTAPVTDTEPIEEDGFDEKTPPSPVPSQIRFTAPEPDIAADSAPHVDPKPTTARGVSAHAESQPDEGFEDVPTDPEMQALDEGFDVSLDDGFDDVPTDPAIMISQVLPPRVAPPVASRLPTVPEPTKKEPGRTVAPPSVASPTVVSALGKPPKRAKTRTPPVARPLMLMPKRRGILCGGEWYVDKELSDLLIRRMHAAFAACAPQALRQGERGSLEALRAKVPPIPDIPLSWMLRYRYVALVLPDVPLIDAAVAAKADWLSDMWEDDLEEGYPMKGSDPYWIFCDDGGNYLGVDPSVAIESLSPMEESLFPREGLALATLFPELLPKGAARAWDLLGAPAPVVMYRSDDGDLLIQDRDAVARPKWGTVVRAKPLPRSTLVAA
ncbi:hypothetical protein EPO34_04845 [Patescibacteria group bacterium]|nr:MAG: hypothetical protein EPO34_04845 [Patescibacteria group bacterium]